MQLWRPRIVRISSGHNACSARAAGTRGYIHICKPDTLFRYPVDIRCSDTFVSVATNVFRADIITEDEDDIRLCRLGEGESYV